MAETLERVALEKIFPLVDERGNEYLSRDYGLDVNKAYIDELAASFGEDAEFGTREPDEHVTLVRDGDVYRVKAGNCRVRAMKQLGTPECTAVVSDQSPQQAYVECVLRTNVKKKYESVEESRYIQQLMLFANDDDVADVIKQEPEKVGRARRGVELAGERAMQLSFEHLADLQEFDGYPDIVGELAETRSDYEWNEMVARKRREKRDIEGKAAFAAVAEEFGIEVTDEDAAAVVRGGRQHAGRCDEPKELPNAVAAAMRKGYADVVCRISCAWNGVDAVIYGKPPAQSEDAEEARLRVEAERLKDAMAAADKAMLKWFDARTDAAGTKPEKVVARVPRLAEACYAALLKQWFVADALKRHKQAKGWACASVLELCMGYDAAKRRAPEWSRMLVSADALSERCADDCRRWLGWAQLHVDDGWKPDEGQAAAIEFVRCRLEGEAPGAGAE